MVCAVRFQCEIRAETRAFAPTTRTTFWKQNADLIVFFFALWRVSASHPYLEGEECVGVRVLGRCWAHFELEPRRASDVGLIDGVRPAVQSHPKVASTRGGGRQRSQVICAHLPAVSLASLPVSLLSLSLSLSLSVCRGQEPEPLPFVCPPRLQDDVIKKGNQRLGRAIVTAHKDQE